MQQFDVLCDHLSAVNLRLLTGADNVDRWTEKSIWDAVLHGIRVVVSTHAVLADALTHGFVKIGQLSLLVFDEGEGFPLFSMLHCLCFIASLPLSRVF